jgi:hypothetical protein
MDAQQMKEVVEMYEKRLQEEYIPKVAMDSNRTFESLSRPERLAHAHYLVDGVKEFLEDPKKEGKANRHLASIQMCLSFAGWYTLEQLKSHNR